MVGCGGNYREILQKWRVETSVTGKWIEYISILFQSIELSSISDQFQRLVLHTCILTYIILYVFSSASESFDSTYQTNVVVTSTGHCTYIPPGAGDFVYFYSLVLQTIHRFHNQFSKEACKMAFCWLKAPTGTIKTLC